MKSELVNVRSLSKWNQSWHYGEYHQRYWCLKHLYQTHQFHWLKTVHDVTSGAPLEYKWAPVIHIISLFSSGAICMFNMWWRWSKWNRAINLSGHLRTHMIFALCVWEWSSRIQNSMVLDAPIVTSLKWGLALFSRDEGQATVPCKLGSCCHWGILHTMV